MNVRTAAVADLEAMVEIHEHAFPGYMLTLLGRGFLSHLYREFIQSNDAIALVAVSASVGGRLDGFIVGAYDPEAFFATMRRSRGFSMAIAAIPALLRHPISVGERLLSSTRFRGDKPAGLDRAALISSLAVSPSARGSGAGKALVAAFCERIAGSGRKTIFLTTDSEENDAVLQFYRACGFTVHSTLKRSTGRVMALLIKEIECGK